MMKSDGWRVQERYRKFLEGYLRTRIGKELESIAKEAGAQWRRPTFDETALVNAHHGRVELILYTFYIRAYRMSADHLRKSVKARFQPMLQRKATDQTQIASRAWARKLAGERVVEIAETTRNRIRGVISSALSEEQVPTDREVARRLSRYIGKGRAMTIARTESHTAMQAGQLEVVQEMTQEVGLVAVKTWVAAEDERTREAHLVADGQVVSLDAPFIVGAELLMYPGDPNGSAENIVNCRCVCTYDMKEA